MSTSIDSVKRSYPGTVLVIFNENKSTIPSTFSVGATAPDGPTARQLSVVAKLNERFNTRSSGADQFVAALTKYRKGFSEDRVRSIIDELSDGEQVKLFEEEQQDDGTVLFTDITEAPPVADTENEVD
jgi:hypothetical protein